MICREALVSWFLRHPNIQAFLGVYEETLKGRSSHKILSIVSPWHQNGNISEGLEWIKGMGFVVLPDVLVCPTLFQVATTHYQVRCRLEESYTDSIIFM